ncbi:MAG: type II toxin-antitoxin system VapB family antitoxin [Candidatus Heimdallarchaeaceae archaeon]
MSFKIPKELKEKMRKYKNQVEWSKELREYVLKKIMEIESKNSLQEAHKIIEETSSVPEGTAKKTVRENRESH